MTQQQMQSKQSVQDYFDGRSVLITGASGFLGKVLIEKLLHDCPGIVDIYILLRTKGSITAQSRLSQLLDSQAFHRIRRIQPDLLKRVKVIRGDVTFDNLGISPGDLDIIIKNVSVIIHSAATIRFDEPLKRAVRINVLATQRVMEMALQVKQLTAFIHVSTAYCNQTKIDIKEQVYEEKLNPDRLIELADSLPDEMLESLTPHLFGDRPSSYHYTKAMAENVAKKFSDRLPIGIVRPSIITASLKDPMPGWIDNYNGPSGYLVTAGKGILRVMLVDGKKICDAIPVDIVANTIITTAWYIGTGQNKPSADFLKVDGNVSLAMKRNEPFVVNCTTGQINPITWEQIRSLSHPWLVKYPTHEMFRYPGPRFVSNKSWHKFLITLEHDLPTYVIDLLFKSLGHNPMLGPIYQKVHRTSLALEYFTLNEWVYRNENFLTLNKCLSNDDSKRFYINVANIIWPSYMELYVIGIRHYLLKEDPSTIDSAKFRLDLLYYASQLATVSVAGASAFVIYHILKRIKNVRRIVQ